MTRVDNQFKNRVYEVVKSIPKGRLMTYGQVATVCGAPWAAWEVGQIAHMGPTDLPWQRVVNRLGGLAKGYTQGGFEAHKRELEAEGIAINEDFKVINYEELIWNPPIKGQKSLL